MNGNQGTRIGVLGGTFNPIHLGHLILAEHAAEVHDLSVVLFLPCALPPHKDPGGIASVEHRVAMVASAIEGNLRFDLSDIEAQRGGVSYTVESARELRKAYPHAELCFIIGSDTLLELRSWKDIGALLDLARFLTFARPGTDPARIRKEDLGLADPWPDRILRDVRAGRQIDISSSDIRYRVAEGLSIRYLVTPPVEMYIAEHGLYGSGRCFG
jgi:nicotinate-nucleotide adenylyltransferase